MNAATSFTCAIQSALLYLRAAFAAQMTPGQHSVHLITSAIYGLKPATHQHLKVLTKELYSVWKKDQQKQLPSHEMDGHVRITSDL